MKRFLRNNGLSLVLAFFFLVFWLAQALTGHLVHDREAALQGKPGTTFAQYLNTGHFWGATGENWESEFLQMGAYVVLTVFLFQKGSAESKDPDEATNEESKPKGGWIYRNSLAIALAALFAGSFAIHATGSLCKTNDEHHERGEPEETLVEFISGPEFWFESFQNWQSEFLAVLSIVTLTIFLRQHGSPESKAVTDPDSKTGA